MANFAKRYRRFELVILVDQFALVGGALKSILGYYKFKNSEREKVLLLSRSVKYRLIKYLLVLFFSRRILVNSLSSFHSWLIIFILLIRKDAVIYFHESDTALSSFRKQNSLKYFFLAKILSRNPIFCIAGLQQEFLRKEFKSNTFLVYNYTPENHVLPNKEGRKIILMAGYLMERKGVSFYSRVADYAKDELGLPWDFYWAGSRSSRDQMYQSANVTWLGDVELMDTLYPQIDAFLLSSSDEPFGLVCVEALKYYKHVVAYRNAGASELLASVRGCAVYEEYEVHAAVDALQASFLEPIDKVQADYIISELMSLKAFVKRVDSFFETMEYAK